MLKKMLKFPVVILLLALMNALFMVDMYKDIPFYTEMVISGSIWVLVLAYALRKFYAHKLPFFQVYSQLYITENCFRSLFEYSGIGMAVISLEGKFLRINQAFTHILKYREDELLALTLREMIHSDDFSDYSEHVTHMLQKEISSYQSVLRYFDKTGEIAWVTTHLSLIFDNYNQPQYFIAQFNNVSNEKRSEEQLRHMAYHDPLTGLGNRNFLERNISELIMSSKRTGMNFAVIIMDLDFFKSINDTFGHDAGDILLEIVAERLRNTVRSSDLIARIGGDEFVILITDAKNAEIIAQIAQKIIYNLLKPVSLKGRELYITTSIGISVYPNDGKDIEVLMKNADLALYRAKENGRNNYQFCTPEMMQQALEKIERKNAINEALLNDEFIMHYQPVIHADTQEIIAVEALLRWKNEKYGLVSPDMIISTAEETGLIGLLGEWILRTACNQVKEWQKSLSPQLKLSINISARQFKDTDFIPRMLSILDLSNFPRNQLIVELSEKLMVHNPEDVIQRLKKLKEIGVLVVLDDFGNGFSSFKYLSPHAIDAIKIDRIFIQNLDKKENYQTISAMLAMVHKLGMESIVEGVETKEQYEILAKEGCDQLQGYYIAKPMSSLQIEELLKSSLFIKD